MTVRSIFNQLRMATREKSNSKKILPQEFNGEGKRLSTQVAKSMKKYFTQLDGEKATDLYKMVIEEVEKPLLESVMNQCNGNQSSASKMLGINRGTLRTKLKEHKLL